MGSGVGGGMAKDWPKATTDSKEAERCYMRYHTKLHVLMGFTELQT